VNIDLLFTKQGEAGLLCDGVFPNPVAAIMLDADAQQISLEFTDMDSMDLNIPVEEGFINSLLYAEFLQVGAIVEGMVTSSRQVPIVFINDPYGDGKPMLPAKAKNSVIEFENFMKRTVTGQPAHREDLGNEATAESVVSGLNTAVLQFAPQLARQKTMEAAPKAPTLENAPKGPGGMGGGGGPAPRTMRPPPSESSGEED
jgi:hypothetical protein